MHKKISIGFIFLPLLVVAQFESHISKITPQIKQRMMNGNSWRKSCPVS